MQICRFLLGFDRPARFTASPHARTILRGGPPLCQFLGKRYPASLHARSPIGNFFGHAFSLHLKLIKARASDKAARTLPRNYKSQSWAINTSAID